MIARQAEKVLQANTKLNRLSRAQGRFRHDVGDCHNEPDFASVSDVDDRVGHVTDLATRMHELAQHVDQVIAGGAERDKLPTCIVKEEFASMLKVEKKCTTLLLGPKQRAAIMVVPSGQGCANGDIAPRPTQRAGTIPTAT